MKMKRLQCALLAVLLVFALFGCDNTQPDNPVTTTQPDVTTEGWSAVVIDYNAIPDYSDSPFYVLNDNIPSFSPAEMTTVSFEQYSELDSLGRCGIVYANIGKDLMPTEERGSISSVKPTGWQLVSYSIVDSGSLYNRCHLIGWQLTAENANEKNLITGTRYMNVDGMLPFENMVADFVKETGNHVLYRVTPVFSGENLVADGVHMEALSVEDDGDGICFNVFCYNVQPGITINYLNGDSEEANPAEATTSGSSSTVTYVLNTSSKKFHYPTCSSVSQMSEKNRQDFYGTREEIVAQGYDPCGSCKP